jgi:hypothetical protein
MKNHIQTSPKEELCQIISKVFNISELEAAQHYFLFEKISPTIKNCLYYLSKIEDEELQLSASLSLEFLVNFRKSPFE